MAVAHPERLSPAVRAGYLFPYNSWKTRIAIDRFVNDIPMRPNHPSYAQLVEIERGLPTLANRPIQLIWGMRDWCFTPKFLDHFVEFFPDAEVHRLADAGHWVVEDAHERIIPLVERFLGISAVSGKCVAAGPTLTSAHTTGGCFRRSRVATLETGSPLPETPCQFTEGVKAEDHATLHRPMCHTGVHLRGDGSEAGECASRRGFR